ncbi:MAG: KOW motif-containing protein [Actinobacteria bacterium]|nr:KOW motif-containing protein [Actinomycetota bacterium]
MSRFKKGDKVLINEGDFKGEWGVIVDKDVIGDEITVALGKDNREIRTHEAHVNEVEDK